MKFLSLASFEQCFITSRIVSYTLLHQALNIKLRNYKNSSENWPQNILWEHVQLGGNSCSVRFSLMQLKLVYYKEQTLISSILLQNGHLVLFSMGHFCSKKVVLCVLSYRLRWRRGGRWRYQDRIQASSYFGTKGRSWLAKLKN